VPDPDLEVRDLTGEFNTEDGVVRAVTGVSYDLQPGEVLGVIGESGSGKSVSVLTMLGLIPQPPGRIVDGEALFKGLDLLKMSKRELRRVRGGPAAMIFQDPMTSLNPVLTVGDQISEAIKAHNAGVGDEGARRRTIELLTRMDTPVVGVALVGVPRSASGQPYYAQLRSVPGNTQRRWRSPATSSSGQRTRQS
jgi:oligopeptide transport system ATP-binding protein